MSWSEDAVLTLRILLGDLAEPPRYADDRLEALLCVAGRLVQSHLSFPVFYEIDLGNATVAPDPAAGDARDDAFVNLTTLRAACIAERAAASGAADTAFQFSDGGSSVDLRDNYKARLAVLEKGWCAVYAEESERYRFGQRGLVGTAVLTPFRVYGSEYAGRAGWRGRRS